MSSLKKNLGVQTAYQILNTCLPLITAPYLSRVLGAEQLGIFSYTSSIAAYFTMIAMLGTTNYGIRCVASSAGSKEARSKTFWSIYMLQLFLSAIVLAVYLEYLFFLCDENTLIAAIQLISIVSCLIDINWLFFGLEKFNGIITRNMVIKVLTVLLIILFVKKQGDLWKYTAIMLLGTFTSNLALWVCLPGIVNFCRVSPREILRHLKPNLILFVPLLAMSVYHTMDKTMLGFMSSYEESGFYYIADKVVNIPVSILSGVGTVMLPRATNLIAENKMREADSLFAVSTEGVAAASAAMAFGISAVAKEFVPAFFGPGYEPCVSLVIVLSPVLIIKGFSLTFRYLYLIPRKKENIFVKSVITGAVCNLIANGLLIPLLGAMGAVIGTLIAECSACIVQFCSICQEAPMKKVLHNCLLYLLPGTAMTIIVRIVARSLSIHIFMKIVIEIGVGAAFFIGSCLLIWRTTNNAMYKELFDRYQKKSI